MLTKSYDKFYMTYTSVSEPYFFYCNFWWYWCDIMWTALWNWMNFRVFIYQTSSFLFGHHYLFLTETVGNIWYMYLEELVQFEIPDHWGMTNFIFISFFNSVHQFFLYIDCNHAQNQGNKISVNPVEGLRIQPVEWGSLWRGQLINKGALLPNAPHHWMTAHCHKSQKNEVFGKKWENYIEINDKNCLPLI